MIRGFDRGRRGIVLASLVALVAGPAYAQEAPDALVKRVSQEVLQIIKTDPKVQDGDQARIREVVETKLLQHFDFPRMTALAMGRNWRKASPDQQKRLADEFRSLLVRTYSGALVQYRNQTIDYKRSARMRARPTSRCEPRWCVPARRRCRSTTAWRRARTAGAPTTSSSAACRSSPTTATSSTNRSARAASTA